MIDINKFTKMPIEKLKKLEVEDKVELLTFKKDRKIIITKKDFNYYDVIEDGFEYKVFENIEVQKLEKLLKQLQKIEFPRSNKFFLKIIENLNKNEQIKFK